MTVNKHCAVNYMKKDSLRQSLLLWPNCGVMNTLLLYGFRHFGILFPHFKTNSIWVVNARKVCLYHFYIAKCVRSTILAQTKNKYVKQGCSDNHFEPESTYEMHCIE